MTAQIVRSKMEVSVFFLFVVFFVQFYEYYISNQALKAVEDGNAALVKLDFVNAIQFFNLALELNEQLDSKIPKTVETPIDAIINVRLREGKDTFENADCLELIETIQDKSYKKPILILKNTIGIKNCDAGSSSAPFRCSSCRYCFFTSVILLSFGDKFSVKVLSRVTK